MRLPVTAPFPRRGLSNHHLTRDPSAPIRKIHGPYLTPPFRDSPVRDHLRGRECLSDSAFCLHSELLNNSTAASIAAASGLASESTHP